jgi:hypothetical protein
MRRTPEGDVELVTKKKILDFQLPPRFEPVAMNITSRWRMASIVYDVALILPQARIPEDGIFGNDRQQTPTPAVALLTTGSRPIPRDMDGFRQGLREAGYVEGCNVAIELYATQSQLERLP